MTVSSWFISELGMASAAANTSWSASLKGAFFPVQNSELGLELLMQAQGHSDSCRAGKTTKGAFAKCLAICLCGARRFRSRLPNLLCRALFANYVFGGFLHRAHSPRRQFAEVWLCSQFPVYFCIRNGITDARARIFCKSIAEFAFAVFVKSLACSEAVLNKFPAMKFEQGKAPGDV